MDGELLELAAKAAGIDGFYDSHLVAGIARKEGIVQRNVLNGQDMPWNPLTNDGDALRLAVKLHMEVCVGRLDAGVYVYDGGKPLNVYQDVDKDPYAATRRAIVRAAAEIGRNME